MRDSTENAVPARRRLCEAIGFIYAAARFSTLHLSFIPEEAVPASSGLCEAIGFIRNDLSRSPVCWVGSCSEEKVPAEESRLN